MLCAAHCTLGCQMHAGCSAASAAFHDILYSRERSEVPHVKRRKNAVYSPLNKTAKSVNQAYSGSYFNLCIPRSFCNRRAAVAAYNDKNAALAVSGYTCSYAEMSGVVGARSPRARAGFSKRPVIKIYGRLAFSRLTAAFAAAFSSVAG